MPIRLESAGYDDHGRNTYITFVPHLTELGGLIPPDSPFVLFIGADARSLSSDEIYEVACRLIARGAVYLLAWGPGCERIEEIFDEAFVGPDPRRRDTEPVLMTTSHPDVTILEALNFTSTAAVPDSSYASMCQTVVVVFVGNISWYNEAQNCLEDLLHDNPLQADGADEIWNRAAMERGGLDPRPGDRALAALLLAHGMVMNGGVQHAVEALAENDLRNAIAGFRFFQLVEAACLLERAAVVTPLDEDTLDHQYTKIIPNDSFLFQCFVAKLQHSPEVFAAV